MNTPAHRFRPADFDRDLPFLRALYASTRRAEMATTGWPPRQVDDFLTQQFEAQHAHYQRQFPDADFELILDGEGEPIGRLYLDERDEELRIVDIALVPKSRQQGIGSAIVRGILERARGTGKAVRIHVEHSNPAVRLYLRLGFELAEDHGIYRLMEWEAGRAGA